MLDHDDELCNEYLGMVVEFHSHLLDDSIHLTKIILDTKRNISADRR